MAGDLDRLVKLVQAVGHQFPLDYRSFLLDHAEDPIRPQQVVSTNPDYWGVRTIFELGEGAEYLQGDSVYGLVRDVIPSGMVPIADDSGGNLYLLGCLPGVGYGTVHWWDHEQELAEERVEEGARSFSDFWNSLVADTD